jgi:hypothetical protein
MWQELAGVIQWTGSMARRRTRDDDSVSSEEYIPGISLDPSVVQASRKEAARKARLGIHGAYRGNAVSGIFSETPAGGGTVRLSARAAAAADATAAAAGDVLGSSSSSSSSSSSEDEAPDTAYKQPKRAPQSKLASAAKRLAPYLGPAGANALGKELERVHVQGGAARGEERGAERGREGQQLPFPDDYASMIPDQRYKGRADAIASPDGMYVGYLVDTRDGTRSVGNDIILTLGKRESDGHYSYIRVIDIRLSENIWEPAEKTVFIRASNVPGFVRVVYIEDPVHYTVVDVQCKDGKEAFRKTYTLKASMFENSFALSDDGSKAFAIFTDTHCSVFTVTSPDVAAYRTDTTFTRLLSKAHGMLMLRDALADHPEGVDLSTLPVMHDSSMLNVIHATSHGDEFYCICNVVSVAGAVTIEEPVVVYTTTEDGKVEFDCGYLSGGAPSFHEGISAIVGVTVIPPRLHAIIPQLYRLRTIVVTVPGQHGPDSIRLAEIPLRSSHPSYDTLQIDPEDSAYINGEVAQCVVVKLDFQPGMRRERKFPTILTVSENKLELVSELPDERILRKVGPCTRILAVDRKTGTVLGLLKQGGRVFLVNYALGF